MPLSSTWPRYDWYETPDDRLQNPEKSWSLDYKQWASDRADQLFSELWVWPANWAEAIAPYVTNDNGMWKITYQVKDWTIMMDAAFTQSWDSIDSVARQEMNVITPWTIQNTYLTTTTFIDNMFEARPDIAYACDQDEKLKLWVIMAVNDASIQKHFPSQDDTKAEEVIGDAIEYNDWVVDSRKIEANQAERCLERAGACSLVAAHYDIKLEGVSDATEAHAYNEYNWERVEFNRPETYINHSDPSRRDLLIEVYQLAQKTNVSL